MNKKISDVITDFLFEQDNYSVFNKIIGGNYENRVLIIEYSRRLIEYCREKKKEN